MGKLAYGMVAAALLAPGMATAQALKDQIVGTWKLQSIYNEDKSGKRHLYGDKPLGILVFDSAGNVVQYLSKPDVPKFAKANRLAGTDQEYRVAMQSIIAGYGSYTVDGDTVSIRWVASSYPNRAGTTEKRRRRRRHRAASRTRTTCARSRRCSCRILG